MTAKITDILNENMQLDEATRSKIQEAWEEKLSEAKAELREEYAQKFEHDKNMIIESMDKFLEERVRSEIEEFAEDKKNLVAERVKYKTQIKEHIKKLNETVERVSKKEVLELRKDRAKLREHLEKLNDFVLQQLAGEIKEFEADKKELVEQRVKLVTEGKKQLAETKAEFVKKAAALINNKLNSVIKEEIQAYREDIEAARKNHFGRQIFEAFASEYMTSYLNEGSEVKKFQSVLETKENELEALREQVAEVRKLVESKNTEVAKLTDRLDRERTMSKLLAPLGKEKRGIMEDLLSTVKTKNLHEAFNKYLPAVLNEKVQTPNTKTDKKVLSESYKSEKTGDRAKNNLNAQQSRSTDDDTIRSIDEIKKLAGISK